MGSLFIYPTDQNDVVATSVFVSGKDVYAFGQEYRKDSRIIKMLKNGAETSISDENEFSYINSSFVLGNDVYVGGNKNNEPYPSNARIWKNGVPINLTDGTDDANVNGVFVTKN